MHYRHVKILLLPLCAVLLGLASCGSGSGLTPPEQDPNAGPKMPDQYVYKGLRYDRRYDDSIKLHLPPYSPAVARQLAIREALTDLQMYDFTCYTDSLEGIPRAKTDEKHTALSRGNHNRSFHSMRLYRLNTLQRLDSLAALPPISSFK